MINSRLLGSLHLCSSTCQREEEYCQDAYKEKKEEEEEEEVEMKEKEEAEKRGRVSPSSTETQYNGLALWKILILTINSTN